MDNPVGEEKDGGNPYQLSPEKNRLHWGKFISVIASQNQRSMVRNQTHPLAGLSFTPNSSTSCAGDRKWGMGSFQNSLPQLFFPPHIFPSHLDSFHRIDSSKNCSSVGPLHGLFRRNYQLGSSTGCR